MNSRNLIPMIVVACSVAVAGIAVAQTVEPDTEQAQTRQQTRDRDRVYGSALMSDQERSENRSRMGELKTEQEREQFRSEQRTLMQERAKERGVALPAEPSANARRAGPRDGSMGKSAGSGGRGKGG